MISAYKMCVVDGGHASEKAMDMDIANTLGVSPDPDINTFIRYLAEYRTLSGMIKRHTTPHTYFLGSDLSYFTHVFTMSQLPELVELVGEKSGHQVELPHQNKSSDKKIEFTDLSVQAKKRIMNYCAGDYALMRGYYSDTKYQKYM